MPPHGGRLASWFVVCVLHWSGCLAPDPVHRTIIGDPPDAGVSELPMPDGSGRSDLAGREGPGPVPDAGGSEAAGGSDGPASDMPSTPDDAAPEAGGVPDGPDMPDSAPADMAALPPADLIVKRASTTPTIDGDLSEFDGATAITWMLTSGGNRATARALWDEQALYLAVDATDTQLNAVVMMRDGSVRNDDGVEWWVDTANDGGASMLPDDYKGAVNLLGTQLDARGVAGGGSPNVSFNGTWEAKASTSGTVNNNTGTDMGFKIEIKLPWTMLGLAAAPGAGRQMGIGIALNDLDAGNTRNSALYPNITSGFNTPSRWSKAVLAP